MGYLSSVYGEVVITPPLPWKAVDPTWLDRSTRAVYMRVEETSEEVPEGVLLKRHVVAIAPARGEDYGASSLEPHLRDAVREVVSAGATCRGELMRVGRESDPGDVERLRVGYDGTTCVHVEKARLTWPDGTEVSL
jgi:hypothetical protein